LGGGAPTLCWHPCGFLIHSPGGVGRICLHLRITGVGLEAMTPVSVRPCSNTIL
jgi:hypothetical protein